MELTTEQRDLRDAVRGLLARCRSPDRAGHGPAEDPGVGDGPGYDVSLWRRLCDEIGVAGLAIPERYGGAGAGPVETCVVLEELGRGLVPSPLLGSAVLAGQVVLASGDDEARQRLLPGIASGRAVAALAWAPRAGHWDPAEPACTARPGAVPDPASPPAPGTWVLDGEAHHVLDGDTAGVLLAAARAPDGIGLFEADPGHRAVSRQAVTSMDTTRRLATVRLDGAPGRRLGRGSGTRSLARARDLACIALGAEQAGAAQRALELTVAYTKTRVQFGRPVGSFQALQHRMADLHVLVESARSLCYAAAFAAADAGADPADGEARVAMLAAAAKAHCSQALARAAGQMIQMHGAIGITWEHDAHRYFKRAHGAGQLFGRPDQHIARVAAAIIDD
jgi:alkylation response protein AidB-like acyl-CoA dehydrogenase